MRTDRPAGERTMRIPCRSRLSQPVASPGRSPAAAAGQYSFNHTLRSNQFSGAARALRAVAERAPTTTSRPGRGRQSRLVGSAGPEPPCRAYAGAVGSESSQRDSNV